MAKTDTRGGNIARLVSPYINTTGKCLELFYWSRGRRSSILSVIAITEENREKGSYDIYLPTEATDFQRWFLRLTEGTNRIAIQGMRPDEGFSTVLLDDVTVMNCDSFGKLNEKK